VFHQKPAFIIRRVFVDLEALPKHFFKKRIKVFSLLATNLEYFQCEPHVQWYFVNEDELDDVEMVVEMPKVHVLNIETYPTNPLI
jgi:hypothetical protein